MLAMTGSPRYLSAVSFSNVLMETCVTNNHPRDPRFVAVVDRWSLFRGSFILQKSENGTPKRWSQ
jgi:hypothetical protein